MLVIGLWFSFSWLHAQAVSDPVADLQVQVQHAEAKGVAKLFGDDVELGMDGEKVIYPRAQAEFVIKDYFRKNPPTSFTIVHQGERNETLRYLVCSYKGQEGNAKVYVLMKKENGKYHIDMMDFSKE